MKTSKKNKSRKTASTNEVKKECPEGTENRENVGTSSRLIVKNLPCGKKTRWDEAKVRAHFSKFGTLTDVRLKLSEKTGACKFAFVGFSSAEHCQNAIKALDGAYIGGSKLTVEECKALTTDRTAITKQLSLNKRKKLRHKVKCEIDEEEDEEGGAEEADVDSLIEKQILDTGRLFLRNLPFVCSEEQIRQLFEPFGALAELECVVDNAGKCKGYALCTFIFPEHAVAAWKALDGTVFMGRMLHIIAGEEKRVRTNGADGDSTNDGCQSAFQRERNEKRKANDAEGATEAATNNRCTWNALFLGTDAVAETLAENYEVEKRDLLLVDGKQQNSAAVRVAMAEARLVRETRKFLLDNGVRLDAFAQRRHLLNNGGDNVDGTEGGTAKMRRSKTTILVKNLDATREGKKEWLHSLFGRFGVVKTVLVPPVHGITAIVEMANARDAKCAFEALAYSKKHTPSGGRPLFLEWAPSDVFDEAHPLRAIRHYGYQQKGQTSALSDDPSSVGHQSPAETKMEKTDGERGGEETGKLEEKPKKEGEEKEDEKHTKILVRNVPFQANIKELTQLFSAFGELNFIRLPKKPGSEGHRGFCFAEFLSVSDARRAMDALMHSTHLYGRRLVLEWAKPSEESAEEKRQRTQDRMAMAAGVAGQRAKKRPKMQSF
ncbi:hypothetical protein niasHT_006933 [Heterodera trifolii]|uniref:RRM domain-containing protein n=1 Tax=Heterodera trifolii TaxID=157864 RepID=A0ABD2LMZ7_9BILA